MMHDDRGEPPRDGTPRGDTPVDLGALLGDARAPERWAALAARIEAAAAPELARRAALGRRAGWIDGVATIVARFAGPALVAAAAAVVIAVGTSRQGDPSADAPSIDLVASAESLSEATVRQALGAEPNAWLGQGASDADDLVRAMYDGGGRE